MGAFSTPLYISMNAEGTRIYVSNQSGSVSIIDTMNNTLIANVTDSTFGGTFGSALTPDGSLLYVVNQFENSVAIIRTSDNAIIGNIDALDGISVPVNVQLELPIILPTANPTFATTFINTAVNGNVLNNDTGVDLTVISFTQGTQGGTVNVLPAGTYVYTPPLNFVGTDSFIYSLEDGYGNLASAAVFISVALPGPTNVSGRTCKNKFASHTDRVNIIEWLPSTDPTVISYNLFRDGILIAVEPANGPFIFFDHNRCCGGDAYSLIAVSPFGVSAPITIVIR